MLLLLQYPYSVSWYILLVVVALPVDVAADRATAVVIATLCVCVVVCFSDLIDFLHSFF